MSGKVALVIRNGVIHDGTGAEPFEADVAVDGGRIVAVGRRLGNRGTQEIDARDRIVTPGFVDIHTHYDGQVTWDERIKPSSLHGVTTCVMGNCGVGFAPCRPEHRDLLVSLMEGVEDIPGAVLQEGVPWAWRSYPEYLEFLAARRFDIDVASFVPHAALRVFVMGERAANLEAATEADVGDMAALLREAMSAGALGFGTSRILVHRSSDGRNIPTLAARENELVALAAAVADGQRGVMQYNTDFYEADAVLAELGRILSETGCQATLSLNQNHRVPRTWEQVMDWVRDANDRGMSITAQVMPRAVGALLSHELTLTPFSESKSYRALEQLPFADKIRQLRRPEVRARILSEQPEEDRSKPLAGRARAFDKLYPLSVPLDYEPSPQDSIAARAARAGVAPEALAYDLLLEGDGRNMLYQAIANYADGSLDPCLKMLTHRDSVLGLGDGGAHMGMICDASYSTFMLTHWARDRTRGGKLPLAQVVRALSHDTARVVGLNDRGRIAAGLRADINVIDFDRLQIDMPEIVRDLPGNGRRLMQKAHGYDATIVSGVITYVKGAQTGALPGRLVRGRQHAGV